MNPIEALMIAFLEDVSNPKTLCTYFLFGATVTLLLEGPIEKGGLSDGMVGQGVGHVRIGPLISILNASDRIPCFSVGV